MNKHKMEIRDVSKLFITNTFGVHLQLVVREEGRSGELHFCLGRCVNFFSGFSYALSLLLSGFNVIFYQIIFLILTDVIHVHV